MVLRYMIAALSFTVGTAGSQIVEDDFSQDGFLAGSVADVGGAWKSDGGLVSLLVSDGALVMSEGVTEEVTLEFPARRGTTIYLGANIVVTRAPSRPWILPFSFTGDNAHGGGFVGRAFFTTGGVGAFRAGVDNNSDAPVWSPMQLLVGQPYRIVLGFTESGDADVTRLWVDPATADAAPVAEEVPESITDEVFGILLNATNTDATVLLRRLNVTTDFMAAALGPKADDEEVTAPRVAFNKERRRIVTRKRRARVRGTAEGFHRIRVVKYRVLPSRRLRTAKGTNHWRFDLKLKKGRRAKVEIRAADVNGGKSEWTRVVVRRRAR